MKKIRMFGSGIFCGDAGGIVGCLVYLFVCFLIEHH